MCLKWLFTESSRVHGSFVNCCSIQQSLAFDLKPLYVFSAEIGFSIMVQLKHILRYSELSIQRSLCGIPLCYCCSVVFTGNAVDCFLHSKLCLHVLSESRNNFKLNSLHRVAALHLHQTTYRAFVFVVLFFGITLKRVWANS